jgi:uncharacterized RDD family membrane protein YckC
VHSLVTGEAVALELRPAAVPSRLLAAGLDGVIQLTLLFGVFALSGAAATALSGAAAAAITIVLFLLVLVGYPVIFESMMRGRTPGKIALGLRVVRDDGGPVGFRHAFVRGLTGAFLERPGITFFAAGVLTMLLNSRGKRVGDLLAGTVVLQERVAVRGGQVAMMPPPLAEWASTVDLSGLPDGLALSVRQFLARSSDLTAPAREDLGGRLVAAVLAVITPPPPPDAPGWAVLSAVLAERRRREEARLGAPVAEAPGWGPTPETGPTPGYGSTPYYGPTPSYGPPPSYGPTPSYGAGPDVPRFTAPAAPPVGEAPAAPGPGGFVAPT